MRDHRAWQCRPETCGGIRYDPCEQVLRDERRARVTSPADRCACGSVTVGTVSGHVAWPHSCRAIPPGKTREDDA